jgi:molybdate/tungstate transport system permease protein
LGVSFYGSQWGIVAAMLFVSAPFAVNSARVAFEAIDPRLEHAARSLGASPWHAFR